MSNYQRFISETVPSCHGCYTKTNDTIPAVYHDEDYGFLGFHLCIKCRGRSGIYNAPQCVTNAWEVIDNLRDGLSDTYLSYQYDPTQGIH